MGKLLSASIIAALTAALFIVLIDTSPTTAELDADISSLQDNISDARRKAEAYNGGLIKSLIEVRIEILSSTEAMLKAKRSSVLRRINLSFHIVGSEVKSSVKLEDIQADIAAAQKRAVAAEAEAAKYSGGLLHVLQLTKAATEHISIAQLNSAYYSGKYGLPTIGAFSQNRRGEEKHSPPVGNIVVDKDAL